MQQSISTTALMFRLYRETGGDLAASIAAAPTRSCLEILNRFRYARYSSRYGKDLTPTGCTRWAITRRGMHFVAVDGTKAERYAPCIAAAGGILEPCEVRAAA